MFRPASRLIARSSAVRTLPRAAPTRRFLSTAPPSQKSRSWKSLVGRVGIVGAIIYYYNTTEVFAEEPRHSVQQLPETDEETEQLPTIEALAKERQQRKAEVAATQKDEGTGAQETAAAGGVEGLEQEANQQGAFNPETGEINWDCPCLGGMADGPCGEQFKAAFSCFVYSTEEPKGMDCIDKFKDMQNCFREYPEVYGSELQGDEEEDDVTADDGQYAVAETASGQPSESAPSEPLSTESDRQLQKERVKAATEQVKKEHEPLSESDELVPKAAYDGREATEDEK